MTFWGFVMTMAILGILVLFTLFWVSINLVNTLWILLAAALPLLYALNKGLSSVDCTLNNDKLKKE